MHYHFGSLLDYSSRSMTRINNLNVVFHLKLVCVGLMMIAVGLRVRTAHDQRELPAEFYTSAKPAPSSLANLSALPTVTTVL
ncbi:MAG: hypothetical protein HC926_02030 [Synechococcaceae cyanobacterium SM2_3_60]|nr:hypothetical protein [Synechococcaceae cyanobacterium SM2_3_60]